MSNDHGTKSQGGEPISESYVAKLARQMAEDEKKCEEITSGDSYILWLENFTKLYPKFSNTTWFGCPENIEAADKEKVDILELFFLGIQGYAVRNYMYLTKTDWGGYYLISYNNVGYKIGVSADQGKFFYCERTETIENSIDFNDIINNVENPKNVLIKSAFDTLLETVDQLITLGVPLHSLKNALSNGI